MIQHMFATSQLACHFRSSAVTPPQLGCLKRHQTYDDVAGVHRCIPNACSAMVSGRPVTSIACADSSTGPFKSPSFALWDHALLYLSHKQSLLNFTHPVLNSSAFQHWTLRCVNGRFRLASLLHIDVTDGGQVDLASEEKFCGNSCSASCVPNPG